MEKNVFVTMKYAEETQGAGWPVAVYATQEEAKAAVAKSAEARKSLDDLWSKLVVPYRPKGSTSCAVRSENCTFPAKNGWFYSTAEQAAFADLEADFYKRDDVIKLRNQQTQEDFFVEVQNKL